MKKMEPFSFEELVLWKMAREFKKELIPIMRIFPPCEKYRLVDQIRRSSRSINALIAEGHGRFTYADQLHFCVQARGSLTETVNHLTDAFDEGYISLDLLNEKRMKAKTLEKVLSGYITFLRKKKQEQNQ